MIEYNAKRQSFLSYLLKNWEYRSLIFSFVKRDIKIKYAQTLLGLLWTVIQPIALAAVYIFFFQYVLTIKTEQPYILFVFSGVIMWNIFSNTLLQSSMSIQQNQDLIKKMYFPKSILFFSKAVVALLDGIIGWLLMVLLTLWYTGELPWYFVSSLLFYFPMILFSLGLSFFVARLAIFKRDILIVLPFFVQLSIWFTPVFYPLTFLPQKWVDLIILYPVNAILDGFRASFALNNFSWLPIGLGFTFGIAVFLVGFFFFGRAEERLMDEL
jgi:lipopolysaccharide transport system permease protein